MDSFSNFKNGVRMWLRNGRLDLVNLGQMAASRGMTTMMKQNEMNKN